MSRTKRLMLIAPVALVGMVVFAAIGGGIVRWLWNCLMPPLFGLPQVSFWQALGLLALCRILFGGLGLHGSRHSARPPLSERWKHMTPEERERFRRGIWGRLGFAPTTAETPPGGPGA